MGDLRIYVACLASYNAGRLHGCWIDCDGKDASDIWAEVQVMLRASPYPNVTVEYEGRDVPSAEEWAIHDSEGFGRMVGESTSFEDVAAIAEALAGDNALGFRYLVDDIGYSVSDAADKAGDVIIFQDDSRHDLLTAYAESLVDDCYSEALESLPDLIKFHIDYEGIGRDLRIAGDVAEAEVDGERFLVANASEF